MVYLYAKAFPLGEGGPQGRMRGDLPSLPGKWAATATRPSSVTFGDSFPPMGEALFPLVRLNRDSFHRSAGVLAQKRVCQFVKIVGGVADKIPRGAACFFAVQQP